ncbi:hypothetical protein Tco_1487488, partial [Tanacetum coccineum]
MTHLHPKRSFVPQPVLTKFGKLSTTSATVNTVKIVNTANTKAVNTVRLVNNAVNHPRTKTNAFKREYSQSSRPFNRHFANKNIIINTNVNTTRVKHTTARDRAVVRKDNKDKSEQNQSKPTKKQKRQDKSEEWKPILKAASARYKSMKLKMKVQ